MSSRKPPTSRGTTTNSGPGRGSRGGAGGGTGVGRGSLRLAGDGPEHGGATATLDEIKGSTGAQAGGDGAEGGPIPFPLRPDARARLLAGVVRVPARPELGSQQSPVIGRIGHDRLVRSIEAELNRMQAAIDQFDADVDAEIEASSLKFPGPGDDDDFRPRAA